MESRGLVLRGETSASEVARFDTDLHRSLRLHETPTPTRLSTNLARALGAKKIE